MDTLNILCKLLSEKAVALYPHLADRCPINRLVKHKIIPDIYILGCSVANKQLAKNIVKIFATKEKTLF